MTLSPLRKNIIFKFMDNVAGINFIPQTKSGIIITDNQKYTEPHSPKWGLLISFGKDVTQEIKEAKFVLIEPGKWTNYFILDGEKFWKTEEEFIMAVTNEVDSTYRF